MRTVLFHGTLRRAFGALSSGALTSAGLRKNVSRTRKSRERNPRAKANRKTCQSERRLLRVHRSRIVTALSLMVYSCAMYCPFWPQSVYTDYDCELYSEEFENFNSFLVFWSSTSSVATRYGLQTTEPKVPICIICCRHKSKNSINQESEPRVERKQMSFGQPQLRSGSFEALRCPAVPSSFKDQSSILTVAML
ncbi:hypothetical protein ALC53_13395 [Atta colombica]|uniref:Uncharacterized protein n=1 Tax=Atta colombica TaxID=520822 RepID=A0A195AVU9_9HYME|nr:hypothetical protein ALC53_13395 [Atta colombica]